MVPSLLIAGLVIGLVLARHTRWVWLMTAVVGCAAGVAVALTNDAHPLGAVSIALLNTGVGALVGLGVRGLLRSQA